MAIKKMLDMNDSDDGNNESEEEEESDEEESVVDESDSDMLISVMKRNKQKGKM